MLLTWYPSREPVQEAKWSETNPTTTFLPVNLLNCPIRRPELVRARGWAASGAVCHPHTHLELQCKISSPNVQAFIPWSTLQKAIHQQKSPLEFSHLRLTFVLTWWAPQRTPALKIFACASDVLLNSLRCSKGSQRAISSKRFLDEKRNAGKGKIIACWSIKDFYYKIIKVSFSNNIIAPQNII